MYDVSRDGQKFLMIKDAPSGGERASAPDNLVVVLNWVEELKARVPSKWAWACPARTSSHYSPRVAKGLAIPAGAFGNWAVRATHKGARALLVREGLRTAPRARCHE